MTGRNLFLVCIMLAGIFSCHVLTAQLVVTNTKSVDYYVQNVLLGPGIEGFNIFYNGQPADEVSAQVGKFECADCVLGMQSGLIMATGDAHVAEGPNDFGGSDLNPNSVDFIYEDDISILLDTALKVYDQAIIEFDFIAQGDTVRLDFIWGSDEYMEYVPQIFNDAFGFFISGPGINGAYTGNAQNIAVIPDTQIPITIDSLNADVNSEYYIFNGNGYFDPEDEIYATDDYYIGFDGFTVPMTAFQRVICGEQYHIKIVCVDVSDGLVDSGIFLRERGFYSNRAGIDAVVLEGNSPDSINGNTLMENCVEGQIVVYPQPDMSEPGWVELEVTGTASNGSDYSQIPEQVLVSPGVPVVIPVVPIQDNQTEGVESVVVHYTSEDGCETSVTLLIMDYSSLSVVISDTVVCPGVSTIHTPVVSGGASPFEYSWSSGEQSAQITLAQGSEGVYTVIVSDACGQETSDEFGVDEIIPFSFTPYYRVCLEELTPPLTSGGWDPVVFYNTEGIQLVGEGTTFSPIREGIYPVTVAEGCGAIGELEVEVIDCRIVIPNVFTPNGDPSNQAFVIKAIEYFPGSVLKVFDRWGTLVYESSNYLNQWDGTDLNDGVYFYTLVCTNGQNYEGYVHLIR